MFDNMSSILWSDTWEQRMTSSLFGNGCACLWQGLGVDSLFRDKSSGPYGRGVSNGRPR